MSGPVSDSLGNKLLQILNQITSAGSAILYLPVRLTDGSSFYTASGGGGGGGPASTVKIQTSSGSALLVIDSQGRIGISNFPTDYFKSGQNIGNTGFNASNLLNPHPIILRTSAGSAFLVIDSNGRIGINNFPTGFNINNFPSLQPVKLQTSAGTACLVIDGNGRIGINYLPSLPAGTNLLGKVYILTSGGTAGLVIDSTGKIGINNFPSTIGVSSLPTLPAGTNLLGKIYLLTSGGTAGLVIDSTGKIGINNFPSSFGVSSLPSLAQLPSALSSGGYLQSAISQDAIGLYHLIRWGYNFEPSWTDGAATTAPAAASTLVTHTVASGKTGHIFGVHITADEANAFWLYKGSTQIKYFELGIAGTVHIVLPTSMGDVSAGTAITIQNVNAGSSGKVYQASLLEGEA